MNTPSMRARDGHEERRPRSFMTSEWLSTTLRPGRVLTDVVLAESGVEITVSVGMIWIPVVGPALMTNAAAIKSP